MKKSLTMMVILVFTSISYAQQPWYATNFNYGGHVYALITANDGSIIAGKDDKVFRSIDSGLTWIQMASNLNESINCFTKKTSNGYLFAGTATGAGNPNGGVYRSINNGINWTGPLLPNIRISSMTVNSNGVIFTGSNGSASTGIRRSIDNGVSWSTSGLETYDIYTLASDNNGTVYAGTGNDGAIFKSTDNGQSWIQIHYWGPATSVRTVAVNDLGVLFAVISTGDLNVSYDGGITWQTKISNIDFYDSAPIKIFSNQIAFLGTYGEGVYQTTNGGANWVQINTGLTNLYIHSLTIDNNNSVYAGSINLIFKNDSIIPLPIPTNTQNFLLEQTFNLYPNPASDKIEVESINIACIEILNLQGLIIQKSYTPKTNTTFDISNLSSGVYIIKAITEKGIIITKNFIKQ
ncbi:MAG TPA: T9SS type A sorting domain-containing protein [Bacteroidales bacterium]|nr:T9SS type A sorting domain-containing protein [Bacteroidales bacterium]